MTLVSQCSEQPISEGRQKQDPFYVELAAKVPEKAQFYNDLAEMFEWIDEETKQKSFLSIELTNVQRSTEEFSAGRHNYSAYHPDWRYEAIGNIADVASWSWICPDCNSKISPKSKYCPKCGLVVKSIPKQTKDFKNNKHNDTFRFVSECTFRNEPTKSKKRRSMPNEYHEPDPTEKPPMSVYVSPELGNPKDKGKYYSEVNYVSEDRQDAIDRMVWGLKPVIRHE